MGTKSTRTLVFDTGALIAFEKGDAKMRAILELVRERQMRIVLPAPVLAQAWRTPAKQVRIRSIVASTLSTVVALDEVLAEAVGALCALRSTNDIVDASLAIVARREHADVVTSDPKDLKRLDPGLPLIEV